ncbi:MAG: DUF4340 domain-containing protein [Alphaproteobacteria bacterium]
MRRRSFIALAAVTAAVVVGAAVAVNMRDGDVRSADAGERLFPRLFERANDVDHLVVRSAEGGTITLKAVDGRWVVGEKADYRANFERVRGTLLAVSQMETIEPRTERPDLLPRLDLEDVDAEDSRSIRVTARAGDDLLADAIIGRWQGEGRDQGLFARRADEMQSWLVKGAASRPDRQPLLWLDRDIVNVDQRRVRSFTITHAGGDIVAIDKPDPAASDYTLTSAVPAGREAKPAHELQTIASITDFLILDDVRPAAELDFSSPAVTARMVSYDGLILDFEGVEGDGRFWVRVAAGTGEPDPALGPFVEANRGQDSAAGRTADQFRSPEEVAEQAAAITARTEGWAYRLTDYKTGKIRTDTQGITQTIAAAEAKPQN